MNLFAEEQPQLPERARVSILERVVPAISFGLASISGVVAAAITISLFIRLRNEENAGAESIAEALATLNNATLPLLGLSIAVGVASVVISLVRMANEQTKSSPPGFLYLITAIPCMISPTLVVYSWWLVADVVTGRNTEDPVGTGEWISQMLIVATLIGGTSLLTLPVFSFVPFSSRRGKKVTAVAALSLTVIGIAAIMVSLMGATSAISNAAR